MEKTEYFCDLCKKEVWDGNCLSIGVFVMRGPESYKTNNFADKWLDQHYKNKAEHTFVACKECIGSEVSSYSDGGVGIKDNGLSLLRRLNFLKRLP